METIELLLQDGDIAIECFKYPLFVAGYRPHGIGEKSVVVESDRGTNHLCMLLKGTVENDLSLIEEANSKYKYPISTVNCPDAEIFFRSLKNSVMEISINPHNVYCVEIITTKLPFLNSFPGVHLKLGTGGSLKEALENVHVEKFKCLNEPVE